MNRMVCMKAVYDKLPTAPVVVTTGYSCREAMALGDRSLNFYMVGSMGLASAIATGIALCRPGPTVVLDGDGALLMNPSNAFMASALGCTNLLHIVLDNGSYESTGGQPTCAEGFDFASFALSIGYGDAACVDKLEDFLAVLDGFSARADGPFLIHAFIAKTAGTRAPRITLSSSYHDE